MKITYESYNLYECLRRELYIPLCHKSYNTLLMFCDASHHCLRYIRFLNPSIDWYEVVYQSLLELGYFIPYWSTHRGLWSNKNPMAKMSVDSLFTCTLGSTPVGILKLLLMSNPKRKNDFANCCFLLPSFVCYFLTLLWVWNTCVYQL